MAVVDTGNCGCDSSRRLFLQGCTSVSPLILIQDTRDFVDGDACFGGVDFAFAGVDVEAFGSSQATQ